jgi:hypothetical protein
MADDANERTGPTLSLFEFAPRVGLQIDRAAFPTAA